MNLNKQNEKQSPLKKGQSAKVKAFTAHFPLKKERNFNSVDVIAEQKKLLIFTGFVFAKSEPRTCLSADRLHESSCMKRKVISDLRAGDSSS
jgi:hypothetical protein